MNRKLTCIICPRGCELSVSDENGRLTVRGNGCPRGEKYAVDECQNPTRTVTSTVKIANRADTQVSVKTETPVPKDRIFDVMKRIRSSAANAPIRIGDVILADVCGANIIATKNID